MGATSPDLLPWPENADPALVPQDMQELATATQTALNKKPATDPAVGTFAPDTGWAGMGGFGTPGVLRHGKVCIGRGILIRTGSDLAVTDNQTYRVGTVPAGFRPAFTVRTPASWNARDSGGTDNHSVATMVVDANGVVSIIANYSGTVKTGIGYVAIAGVTWSAA